MTPRAGATANRVVRFMMDTLNCASAGHKALQTNATGSRDADMPLLTGLMVLLASLKESLIIAVMLEPALEPVQKKHEVAMNEWHLMRHDAAHSPERIFCEPDPKRMANDAAISTGVAVIAYDPKGDTVSTGTAAQFVIGDAIALAWQIVDECKPIVGL